MRHVAREILFLVLLACGLVSCLPENLVWTETHSFHGGEWNREEKISFIPDTSFLRPLDNHAGAKGMKAVVSLRYGGEAPLENIPVAVETENPAVGSYSSDTLDIRLLKMAERSASKGRLGVFETADTIALSQMPEPGWNITLHPLVSVTGLYSLTFEIIR